MFNLNTLAQYYQRRSQIRPGDLIACAGNAWTSKLIYWWTGSIISHVAIAIGWDEHGDVLITESTIFRDPETKKIISGPQTHLLKDMLRLDYAKPGSAVWHLDLNELERQRIDWKKFSNAVSKWQDGMVKYDIAGYLGFLVHDIPWIGNRVLQREDYRHVFCSALDTAIYEECGVGIHVNFSQCSPAQLVRMNLFNEEVQIWGPPRRFDPLFNTY